jgi:hypothetical protein
MTPSQTRGTPFDLIYCSRCLQVLVYSFQLFHIITTAVACCWLCLVYRVESYLILLTCIPPLVSYRLSHSAVSAVHLELPTGPPPAYAESSLCVAPHKHYSYRYQVHRQPHRGRAERNPMALLAVRGDLYSMSGITITIYCIS